MDGNDSLLGRFLENADSFTTEQVAETVQLLVEHGVKWQASDIHIEPHETHVLIRYRVDGSLKSAHKIPRTAHNSLTTHIKDRAALYSGFSATPQQGRFTAVVDDKSYDVQVATMPVIGGEKVVLHVTTRIPAPIALNELGYWGYGLQTLQIAMGRSHGLTIVSAPRHHGRPSTLASLINALQNPGLNIATIEDEPGIRIPHANQTVVDPKAGFSILQGVQAALYQDPNVLLVSNLPDKRTAELTIQAALSGHLVAAGMHSDSAVGALLHLRALGVPPYLISTGVRTVAGQRLVRKLCDACKERYELSAEQLGLLKRVFGINSQKAMQRIHSLEQQALKASIGSDGRLSSTEHGITHLWKSHKQGCDACQHTGYKGRTLLGEVLAIDGDIQRALHDAEQTPASLQLVALKNPQFIPLALDGLVKALRGQIAIKDVLHVVDRSLRV